MRSGKDGDGPLGRNSSLRDRLQAVAEGRSNDPARVRRPRISDRTAPIDHGAGSHFRCLDRLRHTVVDFELTSGVNMSCACTRRRRPCRETRRTGTHRPARTPLADCPRGLITDVTICTSDPGNVCSRSKARVACTSFSSMVTISDRVVGVQQLLGELQPALHEGQPLAVAVRVGVIDVVVVVLPVAGAAVVGRVDVDAVDLACVRESQRLERVVVLALDDDVVRLVPAAFDRPEVPEAREHGLAEIGDHHE